MGLGLVGEVEIVVRVTEHQTEKFFSDGYSLKLPRSGDTIKIWGLKPTGFKFDDGKELFTDPEGVEVTGHLERKKEAEFPLPNINFGDNFVTLKLDNLKAVIEKKVWDVMTGLPTAWILNKVKSQLKEDELKSSSVVLSGVFKVYFWWDGKERQTSYYSNGEVWDLISNNLIQFKELAAKYEVDQRLKKFFSMLREILSQKWLITDTELQGLIESEKMGDIIKLDEAKVYLTSSSWSKDYDEEFFKYLKDHGELIGIGKEGFFFKLSPNVYAFETPENANATYIFTGDPQWVLTQLEEIRRQSANLTTKTDDGTKPSITHLGDTWKLPLIRMKKSEPQLFNWFLERAIHDEDKSAWYRVVNKYVRRN